MSKNREFSKALIMWYLVNRRDLPWRNSKDPYSIWLSEIILQQTKIAQGTSYYEKFIDHFPDVFALAAADEAKVLKLWQGLGYYSRARNLHETAKFIANDLQGVFPNTYKDLLQLKGIGDYTASAIASIAFGKPHATVDGNVYRVLARFFGIYSPIDSSAGSREFKELAQELLDPDDPGTSNQALMEFGALVCTPRNPACSSCILNSSCHANQKGSVPDLPVKKGKTRIRNRYFNYFVLDRKREQTRIRRRGKTDIWKHLYEFPLHESDEPVEDFAELQSMVAAEFSPKQLYRVRKFNRDPLVHKLSHQRLHTTFWIIETEEELVETISWKELEDHALPVLIQNFVDKYRNAD